MGQRGFAKKLEGLSKNALKVLLPAAGLKVKDERILRLWYIDEYSIYEIADDMHLVKESAYNSLCVARGRLETILTTQRHLLPEHCQDIIQYLID